MSKFPLHTVQNAGGDQGTERVTYQTTTGKDRSTDAKLGPLVPLRQQEQGSRKERSFYKSEEETCKQCARETKSRQDGFKPSVCPRNSLGSNTSQRGDHPPDDHAYWKVYGRLPDVVEEHVST